METIQSYYPSPEAMKDVLANLALIIDQKFDQMDQRLDKRFESLEDRFESLEDRFESLEDRFESLEGRMRTLEEGVNDKVGRLQRTVSAIETLPVPYGRPRSFHTATELHSVSGARRVRTGYLG